MLRVQNLVSQYDLDENLLFAGASETSWLLANKGHDLLSAFDDSSLLLSSAVASVSTSSASSSSPATSIRATQPDLFFSEFLSGALDVPVDVVNFEDTVDCTSFSVNNKRGRDEDDLLDHLDDQLFVDDIYQHRVKRPCYTSLFDEEDDEDLRSELVLEEEEDVAIAFSYRDQVLGSLTFSTDAATAYLVAPACVSPTELFFDVELTTSASFSNTAAAPLVSASTSVSAAPVPATAATTVVVDHAAAAVAPSTPGRSISAPSGSLSSSKSKKPRRTKRVHSRREVLEAVSGFDRDEMKGVLRVLYPNQLIIESDGCDLESAISQLDATRYDQLRSYVNNILTQPSKNTSATSSTPALPNTGLTISHATPLSPLSPSSSSLLQPLQPVLPATYQPLPQLSPVFSSPPSSPASSASPPPRSRAPAAKKKSSPKRKTTSSSSRKPKASSTAAATAVAAATAATGSSSSSPLAPAGSVFEKEEVVTMQRAEEDEDEFVDIDS